MVDGSKVPLRQAYLNDWLVREHVVSLSASPCHAHGYVHCSLDAVIDTVNQLERVVAIRALSFC